VPAREPGTPPRSGRQRQVVDAFVAAAREGDSDALIAVLDPGAPHPEPLGGPGFLGGAAGQ
jgi:hypothetical protein